jgi:hypothetical protein
MPSTIEATCDSASYDATVQVYLNVGTRRIAKLRSLHLQNVGQTPSGSTARKQLAAARCYGKKSGDRYADLTFVIHPKRRRLRPDIVQLRDRQLPQDLRRGAFYRMRPWSA